MGAVYARFRDFAIRSDSLSRVKIAIMKNVDPRRVSRAAEIESRMLPVISSRWPL
jgi:hypothetical protein